MTRISPDKAGRWRCGAGQPASSAAGHGSAQDKGAPGPELRLDRVGSEHIPASGGAMLASNHLSIVDSIFLPLMVDRPVTFAAKSEYFTGTRPIDRITGAYLRATKQLSVDRAQARAGQDMLEAALRLLREGALFGIYPEGTRSPDGRLYRDLPSAARQRRAITDEVRKRIQALSGQEYVPVYASVRKEELAAARNGTGPEPVSRRGGEPGEG